MWPTLYDYMSQHGISTYCETVDVRLLNVYASTFVMQWVYVQSTDQQVWLLFIKTKVPVKFSKVDPPSKILFFSIIF